MKNLPHLDTLLATELQAVKHVGLLKKDIASAVDLLASVTGKIVVSGVGKSGYIGMKLAGTLASLGIPAFFLHPHEALHGDLGALSASDGLIAISMSGETKELLKIISHARSQGTPVVGITASKTSSLTKSSSLALVLKISGEGSPHNLAPMASSTATLVLGDMLATALSLRKGFDKQAFAKVHPGGSLGLKSTSVASLMIKKVPTVSVKDTAMEVVKTITKGKRGIVAVQEHTKLVGAITDGDIRRFLMKQISLESVSARQLMHGHPKTIAATVSLHDALAKMEAYKITSLFVVSKTNLLVGLIHLHQIAELNV